MYVYGKLLKAQLEDSASDLTNANGMIYWNSSTTFIKYYNGTGWKSVVSEDGTQTLTNKTLTSPVLNTSISGTAFLDEDDMTSNSATKVASQQSIKAYVDAEIAAVIAAAESLHTVTNADYTVLDGDGFTTILYSTGNTDRDCLLPTAAANDNRKIVIKKIDSGTGHVNVEGETGETIDGSDNKYLVDQHDYITVQSDGVDWYIVDIGGSRESHISLEAGNGHGAVNTKIRRFTTTVVSTGNAITYADSADNGASFTINQDGMYFMKFSDLDNDAGADIQVGISLNSGSGTTNISSITNTERIDMGIMEEGTDASNSGIATVTRRFIRGDVIRPHTNGVADGTSTAVSFRITKVRVM